jgi:ribosomal protein S16
VGPIAISIDTYGMRSQHILTSRIFGLSSDRNPDLEQRIKRHVELVETLNPTPDQEEELESLTEELQEFCYAGARPPRKIDSLSQDDLETLRKRFDSAEQSAAAVSPREGPAS